MSSKDRIVVAVDLGGTSLRVALFDLKGTILQRRSLATEAHEGKEAVIARMVQTIAEMLALAPPQAVVGLGLGVPGPVEVTTGTLIAPPNLPGWRDVPLQSILAARFPLPIKLGNDANLAALGEHRFGAGKGVSDLIYLTISTGIGGGIISGGKLLLGSRGLAGEVGHMSLDPQGPLCNCGGWGCLEALASGTAIARRADEKMAPRQGKGVREPWTAEKVVAAARAGDALAAAVLASASQSLARGLANLVHLFNPKLIIIGGGVARDWDVVIEPARCALPRLLMPGFAQGLEVIPAALGDNAGLYGAVALFLEE